MSASAADRFEPRTCLFSACFLHGVDKAGSDRLRRTLRYLDWYREVGPEMGIDRILLVDNASEMDSLMLLGAEIVSPTGGSIYQPGGTHPGGSRENVTIIRCPERLESSPSSPYPYCWRALYMMHWAHIAGFEKIVACDTDTFVLNSAFARYVRDLNSGWVAFRIPKWGFPSAEFFVLNADAMDLYLEFTARPRSVYDHVKMEEVLPFTEVRTDFGVDRYGEDRKPQTPEMDLYSQAPLDIPLTFNPR